MTDEDGNSQLPTLTTTGSESLNLLSDGNVEIQTSPQVNIQEENIINLEEGEEEEDSNKRKLTSIVWEHYKRQRVEGVLKAICNYCGSKLGAEPKNGTKHLHMHLKNCKRKKQKDPRQMLINAQKKKDGAVNVSSYTFDQDAARKELASMIVLHEFPLSMVEYEGFRSFTLALQPLFQSVSRSTITRDIFKMYDYERGKTLKLLERVKGRIAITTDMWTSNHQKRGFMAITTHFIDDSWVLQSRIMRFVYVPSPHTADALSQVLLDNFFDWNIDRKISTVTVDNCSTNDAIISNLLEKLDLSSLWLHGSLFHMRCAHILNLIVKDGLEVIGDAIDRIRDSVAFWTGSQKREEKFDEAVRQLKIACGKKICLDCKTRWNSTFLMLQTALIYKDVFVRLRHRDPLYKNIPSENDWEVAKEICDKLKLFYTVTELFSGTKYPTANLYFPYVCQIKVQLSKWVNDQNLVISRMATCMMEKFSKYWDNIHCILGVAVVLDPRFKMKLLHFNFRMIFGENEAEVKVSTIRKYCYDLLQEYKVNVSKKKQAGDDTRNSLDINSEITGEVELDMFKDYDLYISMNSTNDDVKSEFDHYLDEGVLPRTPDFDILSWWRTNGVKFPTLQMIARDVLAIPISTVASESAFSTSGRWVSPHRSSLHPKTLEALMCTQNWLWTSIKDEALPIYRGPPCVKDEEEDING